MTKQLYKKMHMHAWKGSMIKKKKEAVGQKGTRAGLRNYEFFSWPYLLL